MIDQNPERQFEYLYIGTIHPLAMGLWMKQVEAIAVILVGEDTLHCTVSLHAALSRIHVKVCSDKQVLDIPTLTNTITGFIEDQISFLGFIEGCGYAVELTDLIRITEGISEILGVNVPVIANKEKSLTFDEVRAASQGSLGSQIARSIRDFNFAMRVARDSAFYCFRALERIKTYFVVADKLTEPKAWEKFRIITNSEKDTINRIIKDFADFERHGQTYVGTPSERMNILQLTHDLLERLVHYNLTRLPEGKVDLNNYIEDILTRKEIKN